MSLFSQSVFFVYGLPCSHEVRFLGPQLTGTYMYCFRCQEYFYITDPSRVLQKELPCGG